MSLVGGQGENAGDIVVEVTVLLFAEVSNNVTTIAVSSGHHVEEEGFYVIVQSLVVQERLGDQTKVLTVLLVLLTTHLKDNKVFQ